MIFATFASWWRVAWMRGELGKHRAWTRLTQRAAGPVLCAAIAFGLAGPSAIQVDLRASEKTLAIGNAAAPIAPVAASSSTRIVSYVTTQDEWAAQLRSRSYWDGRRGEGGQGSRRDAEPRRLAEPTSGGRSALGRGSDRRDGGGGAQFEGGGFFGQFFGRSRSARDDDEPRERPWSEGYKTVCVRLCDGYYWPISAATTRENFGTDARKCEASCGGNSRLFTSSNISGEAAEMTDLRGQPYKKLATAFRYRETYDSACTCRPHPWEDASLDRHQIYKLERARAKGDKRADGEMKDLRGKIGVAARAAEVELTRHTKAMNSSSAAAVAPGKGAAVSGEATPATARNRYMFMVPHAPAVPKLAAVDDGKPAATIATARVRPLALDGGRIAVADVSTVRVTSPAGTTVYSVQRASVMRLGVPPPALPRVINAGKTGAQKRPAR